MKKTIRKICSNERNEVLLFEHINSKEHKDIEDYLIVRGMTYFQPCDKEIRNDEWRKHLISEKHSSKTVFIVIFVRKNFHLGTDVLVHFTTKQSCQTQSRVW